MTMKVSRWQKTFNPPSKILEIPLQLVVLLKPTYMQKI